jgi:hypothetical protein
MSTGSEKFVVTNVQPIWTESREITTTPRPPQKTGVRSADVHCKTCGHDWTARNRDGSLDGVLGGTLVTCPQCRTSEAMRGLL